MEATKTFHSVTLCQFKVLAEKALLVFDAINEICAIGGTLVDNEVHATPQLIEKQQNFVFDPISSNTALNNVLVSIGIQPVDFLPYFKGIRIQLDNGSLVYQDIEHLLYHPIFDILTVLDCARQGEHNYAVAVSRLNNMSHAIWRDDVLKVQSGDKGKSFTQWKWCLEVTRPNSVDPGIKLRIKPRYNACECGLRMTEGLKIEKLHGQFTYTPLWECSCGLTKTRLTAN